jgi:hypothetical protein
MNTTTEKQTAIEWLIEQIENQRETGNIDLRTTLHFCDKAKEMEKQQIRNALHYFGIENAEQYYKETFNK